METQSEFIGIQSMQADTTVYLKVIMYDHGTRNENRKSDLNNFDSSTFDFRWNQIIHLDFWGWLSQNPPFYIYSSWVA